MSGCGCEIEIKDQGEKQVLWWLLAINASMFVFELLLGWYAQSTGLIADSLDMLADATVYAISLYAVGRSLRAKSHAASLSGVLQILLAVGVLTDVSRRFIMGSEPLGAVMMGVSLIALAANITCLLLIARHREGGVHMRASWIFSANDVLANLGVIIAGVLVYLTASRYPDLIIGLLIAALVLRGGIKILREARASYASAGAAACGEASASHGVISCGGDACTSAADTGAVPTEALFEAHRLFAEAGLPFPHVPRALAEKLEARGHWVFATRALPEIPYFLQYYVEELEAGGVGDYVLLAHSGHGANSQAIQYYLVEGPLAIFVHLGWGGVYMDAARQAERIASCFALAHQIEQWARAHGQDLKGRQLRIVVSDFYGSDWHSDDRHIRLDPRDSRTPEATLQSVLDWLNENTN